MIELVRDLKLAYRLRVAGLELELMVRAGDAAGLVESVMGEAVKSTPGWVDAGLGVWAASGSSSVSVEGEGMMVLPLRKEVCWRTTGR